MENSSVKGMVNLPGLNRTPRELGRGQRAAFVVVAAVFRNTMQSYGKTVQSRITPYKGRVKEPEVSFPSVPQTNSVNTDRRKNWCKQRMVEGED